jgi:predicted nucleic acid-binding protein
MAFYLDTSAAVKLVVSEPQSKAMSSWADANSDAVVSSDLLRTELLRTTLRGAPDEMPRAREVLDSITIVSLPTPLFERAAALDLGDELDGIVTYDDRLTEAAKLHGVPVIAPT